MKRIKNSITKQVQIEYETLNMLEQIATKQNITLGEAIRQTLRDAMRFQHRIPDCATPHIPARKREKRKITYFKLLDIALITYCIPYHGICYIMTDS